MSDNARLDDLVSDYVRIRDALAARRKEYKEFEVKADAAMAKIEMKIMGIFDELGGVQNMKTKYGTAFIATKDFARVSGPDGWNKLCEYMRKTGDFGLVEKRVAKLHFKEVMSTGVVPAEIGVDYVTERAIQVRR
jgi:hypothetical protein